MKRFHPHIVSLLLILFTGDVVTAGDFCRQSCSHREHHVEKAAAPSCHEAIEVKTEKGCVDMGRCYLLGELEHDPFVSTSALTLDQESPSSVAIVPDVAYEPPSGQSALELTFSRPPPQLFSGRSLLLHKQTLLI